jgi:hypothetical protein
MTAEYPERVIRQTALSVKVVPNEDALIHNEKHTPKSPPSQAPSGVATVTTRTQYPMKATGLGLHDEYADVSLSLKSEHATRRSLGALGSERSG